MNKTVDKTKHIVSGIIVSIMLVMVMVISTGCKQEPVNTLTIGVMADVGAIPFYIAQENGYFEELGLDVEIQVFKSAVDRDAGIQTGNLQGAMVDTLALLFLKDADVNMKVTSTTYGNYRIVTAPNLDITDFMAETKKSIGISSNTVIDFATQVIAADQGFTDELDSIAIPQMPVRLEMLKSGELTAVTLPEPLASLGILEGGVVVGDTEGLNLYPGIFIFNEQILNENPEMIKKFYEAYNKAVDYLNTEPMDTYYESLVETLSFPPSLQDSFEMPIFEYAQGADEYTYNQTMEWMIKLDLIKATYDFEELSDNTYLQSK